MRAVGEAAVSCGVHLQNRIKRYWRRRRATRGVFVRPRLGSRSWTDFHGTCPGGRLRVSSVKDGAVEFLHYNAIIGRGLAHAGGGGHDPR